jgi:hypothetical protein
VASNPGHIAAGGSEKISVVVSTKNKGGATLHKGFTVFTNDPNKPRIRLSVVGKVKGYILVLPVYVRLTGAVGEPLRQTVKLTPQKGYPFTIKSITAQRNEFVRYKLQPVDEGAEGSGYLLTVENTRTEAGNYHDTLIIETDSPHKPTLKIPVYGRIFNPPSPPPPPPPRNPAQ